MGPRGTSQRRRHDAPRWRHSSHSSSAYAAVTLRLLKLVEQQPLPAAVVDARDGFGECALGLDRSAHVGQQASQVMLFGRDCRGPCACPTVSRNRQVHAHRLQLLEDGKKSAQTAVDDRHVTDEQEIAEPQRCGGPVEHSEVRVRVRSFPGAQAQYAPAEVEFIGRRNRSRWQDHLALPGRVAKLALERVQVIRAAPPHRIGKARVADEVGSILDERRIAEDVIRMHVRIDDVAHRCRRDTRDRPPQRATHRIAAAGIDHRDATRADDEAEVRHVAGVGAGHLGLLSIVNVDARRGILQREVGQLGGFGGDGARPRDRRIRQGKREPTQGR